VKIKYITFEMKHVSIAPSIPSFSWQVDLAYHQHSLIGGLKDDFMELSPYINSPDSVYEKCFPNYIKEISVKPFWEFLDCEYSSNLIPINIQTSLAQIFIEDDEEYMICDADIFCFKQKEFNLEKFDIHHEIIYDQWHIHQHTTNAFLKKMLPKEHQNFKHSGFVPIVAKGKTIKKILPDWIDLHIKIVEDQKIEPWHAGMYSYNLACALHNLKIKEDRICALPFDNEITENMFCLHYSVGFQNFDKHRQDFYFHREKITNIDFCSLTKSEKIMFMALINWYNESNLSNDYI